MEGVRVLTNFLRTPVRGDTNIFDIKSFNPPSLTSTISKSNF